MPTLQPSALEISPTISPPRALPDFPTTSSTKLLRTRAPRVLHAITPSRMAGAETFLARLLRRSSPEQVVNHCISSPSRANSEMIAANMPFDRVAIGGKGNPLAMHQLRNAAHRFSADILHSHLSSASWWCGWLEQIGGPPSIGHVHGFTSALWHSRQRHLIACTAAVKKDLIEKGIAGERITVMHYPVDPNDMRPTRSAADVRAELGAGANTPVVGTFAHLSPKKGYRELIQAAHFVLQVMPQAQFWCFGDGPLRPELEQTARELGIADRFKLWGFRHDVPDLMRAIDVMCLPSHREPFGLVYIEAALAEKPVIACDAGGTPEIVAHGETGLLIPPPPDNITPLADAIFQLLDNRDQASTMGRRGREQALDRFTWPAYLTRLADLYDKIRG